jgi:iron-sulfur cluster assembly protein
MFQITESAAQQIREAADQGGTEGMALRLAAQRKEDGSIDYLMGFDEEKEEDVHINSFGVEVVFDPSFIPLLNQAVMDFVEIEQGDFRFIFMNPEDANYQPPESA